MLEIYTDILVIGGGSAGVAAAVSAAYSGKEVVVVEQLNYLGGTATFAEVGTICGLYKFSKSQISEYITHGFAKEFADELKKLSETNTLSNSEGLHYLPYKIEAYKDLCLRLLQKNNIQILFNTEVISIQVSEKLLKSVIVKTERGSKQIHFKAIIDCSGNSCISQLALLPTISSKSYQAAAQVFTIKNIPQISEDSLSLLFMKELQKAIYNKSLADYFNRISVVQGSLKNDSVSLKIGIPIDVTLQENNVELLRTTALEIINTFINYFTTQVPFFKYISLHSIAPQVGIRVGVRPIGKYILTEEDVLSCRKFEHAIANGSWPLEEWGQNKRVKISYFNFDDFYQIPADCLKSATICNLFFAGRNISATDIAIASARVMGICFQTGYAAGALATGLITNSDEINTIKDIQRKQIFA